MFINRKKVYIDYDKYNSGSLFKLVLDDVLVPQGICYVDQYVFISCYATDSSNSKVLMFDISGKLLKAIDLLNRSHVGGIGYDKRYGLIFICDSCGMVSSYPYKEFIKENLDSKKSYMVADDSLGGGFLKENGKIVCSYLNCFEGKLYVGSFNKKSEGLVKEFLIECGDDGCCLRYLNEFVVPSKIQGIDFYRGFKGVYMFLSRSYTRVRDSSLLVYKYESCVNDYSNCTFSFLLPPMLEQVTVNGDTLLLLFESYAMKYKGSAKVVVDEVVRLNVLEIIRDFLKKLK